MARLNTRTRPLRKRNPGAAIPAGDLTVRLADGREVNTTPAFVDANGKLFQYDDYIKGALLNRFPKDDSIPFYAFSANQKAAALFEKRGAWAKNANELSQHEVGQIASELKRRDKFPADPSRLSLAGFAHVFDRVFPSKSSFDASGIIDISADAKKHAEELAMAMMLIPNFRRKAYAGPMAYALDLAIEEAGLDVKRPLTRADVLPVWNHSKWILHHPESRAEIERRMAADLAAFREGMRGAKLGGTLAGREDESAQTGTYPTADQSISGMQYAQALQIQEALMRRNPYMVTTGGQAVPWGDEEAATWAATARHTQRHESEGRRYILKQLNDGFWHVVDAKTGAATGKYASTAARGQEILGKMLRRTNPYRYNPSPVPGISLEEVIADIDGQEWANWDLNRAGIMHWRGNPRGR